MQQVFEVQSKRRPAFYCPIWGCLGKFNDAWPSELLKLQHQEMVAWSYHILSQVSTNWALVLMPSQGSKSTKLRSVWPDLLDNKHKNKSRAALELVWGKFSKHESCICICLSCLHCCYVFDIGQSEMHLTVGSLGTANKLCWWGSEKMTNTGLVASCDLHCQASLAPRFFLQITTGNSLSRPSFQDLKARSPLIYFALQTCVCFA